MRKLLLLVVLGAALAGCETAPPQPDPMQIRINDIDTRLGRVEGVVNNGSLVTLSQRIDALQAQMRELRGDVEELQNSSSGVRKQQRDLYSDLDKRLSAIEKALKNGAASNGAAAASGGASAAGTASGATAGGAAAAGNAAGFPGTASSPDQAAYSKAFDTLKAADYAGAITQFHDFLSAYPNSSLLDNAEYWLGEAYYVTRDYDSAATAFRTVGERWPQSRKAPDALLKLGYTQLEQKHYADGRATLNQVLQRFPDSNSAKLAAARLQKLPADAPEP